MGTATRMGERACYSRRCSPSIPGASMSADQSDSMAQQLGLPPAIRVCLFDLDGVVTRTAAQHAKAWKTMFDAYLKRRAERTGEPFVPFEVATDYVAYVDGKRRLD